MKYLLELTTEVQAKIQDKDGFVQLSEIKLELSRAIRILSLKSPYLVFEEFAGDGSVNEWALDTDLWKGGFSSPRTVYYPWDDDNNPTPPPPLNASAYSVYEKTEGVYYFRLNAITPSSSETVRVFYNSRHVITETSSTLRDEADEDSIVLLASAFCLDTMAIRVIAQSNSNIGADITVYQSRQQQYAAMSKMLKEQSGLAPYISPSAIIGGATFVSMGRSKRAVDNFV